MKESIFQRYINVIIVTYYYYILYDKIENRIRVNAVVIV